MVRVNPRRLIELQGAALRAAELLEQNRTHAAETSRLTAQNRAAALLAELPSVVSTQEVDLRASALDDLPLTGGGELHEAAFLALVEARAWEQHEDELRRLAQAVDGDRGGRS